MRLVIATCSVDYDGRLTAHLPLATRLLLVKADGSVLVHSDGGSYKPLNWMSPPCAMAEVEPDEAEAATKRAMARAAQRVIVLADSSKLGREHLVRFAAVEDVDVLVTDGEAEPGVVAELETMGIEVLVA